MITVKTTVDDLAMLLDVAKRVGTLDRWADVALDWMRQADAALAARAADQPEAAPVEYECVGYQYKFPSRFTNGSTWRDSPADYNGIRSTGSRKIFAEIAANPTSAAPDTWTCSCWKVNSIHRDRCENCAGMRTWTETTTDQQSPRNSTQDSA